uniref:Cell morphogenesis central region domain-containing protein n=1 Tax=Romanomermis culicivorax TaxID=13658 RepID=A0A915J268_ROMCU
MADMRDLVVLGLGSINPASFDYLLEELAPFLREASERKQENLRRKKRKDLLRLQLIRLMEMAVFRHTISSPQCRSCVDPNTGQLKQVLLDFIENARLYLEADHDRDQQTSSALHLHFAKFVASLVLGFATEKRVNLIPNELRKNLFYLFASWSGRLGLVLDKSRQSRGERDCLSSDEYFAVAGMCAILTCGPVFDSNAISDERGYIFGWMDALISSQHEKVNVLSEETLVLLLDYNSDNAHLLEWVVDKCFTSSSRVADKCFRALASIFSNREYPCDVTSMLNLALMYTGYPVTEMQKQAAELLQILYQRYFTSISHSQIETSPNAHQGMVTSSLDHSYEDLRRRDVVGNRPTSSASHIEEEQNANIVIRRPISMSLTNESTTTSSFDPSRFSKSQITLSQKLAAEHPELTLQIFSDTN